MSQIFTKSDDKDHEEKILMPFSYIQQVPGKQIRGKLTIAFNYWLKVSDTKLRAVGEIVQMLHNSSLLFLLFSTQISVPSTIASVDVHLCSSSEHSAFLLSVLGCQLNVSVNTIMPIQHSF